MAKKEVKKEKEGYVPIFLFKDDQRYKDPVVNVIINGVKYSVPRGKQVMVPKEVAIVLERSQEGDRRAQMIDEEMQKEQVSYM